MDAQGIKLQTQDSKKDLVKTPSAVHTNPKANRLLPWLVLFGDFILRVAVCLTSFQISYYDIGSYSGYTTLIPFVEGSLSVPILAGFCLLLTPYINNKIGIIYSVLLSCVIALLLNGQLILMATNSYFQSILFTFAKVHNYYVIIFEPARTALCLSPVLEKSPLTIWVFCALTVWLRDLALITSTVLIQMVFKRTFSIVNAVSIGCLTFYGLIMLYYIWSKQDPPKDMTVSKLFKCYVTTLQEVKSVTEAYVKYDEKFTMSDKACMFSLVRISKALSGLVAFYSLEQVLLLIWQFQSNIMVAAYGWNLANIHFKLAVINLVNTPIVMFVTFVIIRVKKEDTQAVLVALVVLFISSLVTFGAQMIVDDYKGGIVRKLTPPGFLYSQIRIFNIMPEEVEIDTHWTKKQTLQPYSVYISDHFEVDRVAAAYINISGPEPLNFCKSVFTKSHNGITIIVTKTKVRRVSGYDAMHYGVFDTRQNKAILVVHSVLNETDTLLLRYLDMDETISIPLSKENYQPTTELLLPGRYEIINAPPKKLVLRVGEVSAIIFFNKNGTEYLFEKQYLPFVLPLWSVVGLYLLSLSYVLERVFIIHFIITSAPHGIKTLQFAWYQFIKALGLYWVYFLLRTFGIISSALGLFSILLTYIVGFFLYNFCTFNYKGVS